MDLFITEMHSDMSKLQLDIAEANVRVDFEKQKSEAWCTMFWTDEFLRGPPTIFSAMHFTWPAATSNSSRFPTGSARRPSGRGD